MTPDLRGPRKAVWIERLWLGVPLGESPRLVPGIAVASLLTIAATLGTAYAGDALLRAQGLDPARAKSPLSPMMAAIVLGLIVGNVVAMPKILKPGLDFCTKKLLRLGIIFIGLKLSLVDVFKLGAGALPAVVGVVAAGLWITPWIARRLGVSERLGFLAAASTAICGVSAALAVAPVVEADERETACTVANVTLFGLIAMLVHPWIAHAVFADSPGAAGLFLGTAIHDTSQVMGAATVYGQIFDAPRAAEVATVAKLVRNFCLIGVVPYLAWRAARGASGGGKTPPLAQLVPLFVVGFVAAAAVRSIGDAQTADGGAALGIYDAAAWKSVIRGVGDTAATTLLAGAMAAVGLSTRFAALKTLGPKPFVLGGAAALVVGFVGLALAAVCGRFVV